MYLLTAAFLPATSESVLLQLPAYSHRFGLLSGVILVFLLLLGYKFYQEKRFRRRPYYARSVRSWESQEPSAFNPVQHRVFLVGDIGNVAPDGDDAVLAMLRKALMEAGKDSTVAFLGDNVYPVGLPPEGHRHRHTAEQRLLRQLEVLQPYPGRVIYLGGNHDWNKGRAGGLEQVLREERFIEAHLPGRHAFLPSQGLPGPVLVQAAPQLLVLVLNTQWWVQNGEKPMAATKAQLRKTNHQFFEQLAALLQQHRHRQILVLAHHPLYSNAMHGGNFTVKQHFFPLTAAHKKLYMPLPILGSLYPLYRQYLGAAEDISFPRFRKFRKQLLKVLRQHKDLVYVAGHDHNLQHFCLSGNHYLVSGSASKTAFVAKGGKARFTFEHLGFMRLDYHQNGEVWLYALQPDLQKKDGTYAICYRTKLLRKKTAAAPANRIPEL